MCFVSTEKSTKYGVYDDNLRLGNKPGYKSNYSENTKPKSGFQVSLDVRVIEISPKCSGTVYLFHVYGFLNQKNFKPFQSQNSIKFLDFIL